MKADQASGPLKKRELETTATEEKAINAPAAEGLRATPYAGKRAPAASGTPTALYVRERPPEVLADFVEGVFAELKGIGDLG